MVVLQEQGRGLGVVLAGSDVQGRQAYLALCIVLQQQGDHLVMALLEGHRQRGEAILCVRGRAESVGLDGRRDASLVMELLWDDGCDWMDYMVVSSIQSHLQLWSR